MAWQASGRTNEILKNYTTENEGLKQEDKKSRQRKHKCDEAVRFVVDMIVIVMMVWTDLQTGQGTIAPTIIAAFVLMSFSITDALLPVSDAVEEVPSYTDSITRIQQVEHQPLKTNQVIQQACKHQEQ